MDSTRNRELGAVFRVLLPGLFVLTLAPGSLGAQFAAPNWLEGELALEVEALIGNVWDQRMARRTGMDTSMPLAEVAERLEVFARWVDGLQKHGGELEKELLDGLKRAQESIQRAKGGAEVDLDPVLVFLEDGTLVLQKASKLSTDPPDARGTSARRKPPDRSANRLDWSAFGGDGAKVDGVPYIAPQLSQVAALDPGTGEPVGPLGDQGKADLLPERGR